VAQLSVFDHSRDAAGLTYVYPVVSRRAGGVSVGVNLSPNDACNFRCVYCQVPGLVRGRSPAIELPLLARELALLLGAIEQGDFLTSRVPPELRTLRDVAFSGNGEPTSSPDFAAAVGVVAEELTRRGLLPALPLVLITNGTLTHRPEVRAGLERLRDAGGRVWFKLDGATRASFARINDTPLEPEAHLERLQETARLLPTWVQTCLFARDGAPPTDEEREAYLAALARLLAEGAPLRGVLLYGLARPSLQPEAPSLFRLPPEELERWAEGVRALGLPAEVHP
jgi:wyosine [tRNA(Phe)-imidazoG37] synthetase (radical SAM superfamily)